MAALSLAPNSGDSTTRVLPVVRRSVRELLESTAAFAELDADDRRRLAATLVEVCSTAVNLVQEERDSELGIERNGWSNADVLSVAQAVPFGEAASRIAGTTSAVLNAVSFPRFVGELITGVFKAILDTNAQQLHQFIELLNNVAGSSSAFSDANFGPDRAREWLVERYPGTFEIEGEKPDPEFTDPEDAGVSDRRVVLRPGASPPPPEALRVDLGLEPDVPMPSGDPEESLLPLVRRQLARTRQQMLATMIQLGLQRIVVDGGKINASMRFHIDTRSATQQDTASRFDMTNSIKASGSFGLGPWGASASIQNTIGFVSTQSSQSTEELNTDLDLNSSVEILFRTDQVPLDRLASARQVNQVLANSRNPEAEAAIKAREARTAGARQGESDRARRSIEGATRPTPPTQPSASPETPAAKSSDQARPQSAPDKLPAKEPPSGGELGPAGTASAPRSPPAVKLGEHA